MCSPDRADGVTVSSVRCTWVSLLGRARCVWIFLSVIRKGFSERTKGLGIFR